MKRRTILKGTMAALLGTATVSGSASASGGQNKGYLPDKNVPHTHVYPFLDPPQKREAGQWIIHRFGWVAVPVESKTGPEDYYYSTKEEVERYKESVNLSASIEGEKIENADQYWREPEWWEGGEYNNLEGYIIYWDYAVPPKKPGEYEFELEVKYEEPYEINEPEAIRREGTTTYTSSYSIVPERVHERSKNKV